jgi:phosphoribosylformimino-5-aminoimidazole carboxamide ribotide isomerase
MGGGIRSLETAKAYLAAGVNRLIIGTLALENPPLFASLCAALPGKIGVSLDVRSGRLKIKGWAADAGLNPEDVLPRLAEQGSAFFVHTDINRDGMQSGVNLPALTDLAAKSPLPIIAAGGVATLEDIQKLYPLSRNGKLEGAISGQALYAGSLNLPEAAAWIAAQAP